MATVDEKNELPSPFSIGSPTTVFSLKGPWRIEVIDLDGDDEQIHNQGRNPGETQQAVVSAEQPLLFHNSNNLTEHLNAATPKVRIATIRQCNSWAPLDVSRDMFEALLNSAGIMEEVWDTVLSFRVKTAHVDHGDGPCAWKQKGTKQEISYVFKYPEQKTDEDGNITWAIRQSGMYQQYDVATQKHTWLLVAANRKSFSAEDLNELMRPGKFHPLHAHAYYLLLYLGNWRWYISDCDKQYQKSAKTVMNVEIEERLDFVEMYDQLSTLRFVETKLGCTVPIFAAHHRIVGRLRRWNETLAGAGQVDRALADEFAITLDSLDARMEALEFNARFLLSRISSTVQMASDTISLKSQNTAEKMANHMLVDSAAIRVITVVTLIYLPATFTSGFFGMGFFTTDPDQGGKWIVAPYLWVYFILTLPLTALTITWWKWRSRREKYMEQRKAAADKFP
ncbi:hypothetical protein BX600DRAFT_249438 [Xylariales sp. PMI_506]|nr:hypothetical protein BX600DRAFT_249438 [Xylariales sp. PMI_506]